jgi:hypothetical protein
VSRHVNLLRFLILLTLVLTLNGCVTTRRSNFLTRNKVYRTVRVTDFQGHLVADWVAEGWVWRYGPGYRFRAMERVSGGPYPTRTRYPYGRKVIVNGTNIVVTPCDKPEWLRVQDGF